MKDDYHMQTRGQKPIGAALSSSANAIYLNL